MATDRKSNGFTIFEIVISITIVLMISSTGVLGYNKVFESDIYVNKFVSDIRYVYHKNGYGDINCQLSYIYESSLNTQKIMGYYIIENSKAKTKNYLPKYLKLIPDHKNNIRFTQNGALTFNGETINLIDSLNEDRYRVTIVPTSGRVMVYKNE